MEEKVSNHATQLSSLRSKFEWLSTRVEQLSNSVEAAKAESSSASDKAIRAADTARKAIAIARQRIPPSEDIDTDQNTGGLRLRQPDEPPNGEFRSFTELSNPIGLGLSTTADVYDLLVPLHTLTVTEHKINKRYIFPNYVIHHYFAESL